MLLQNIEKVLVAKSGVTLVEYEPTLSPLFIFFNFLEDCLKEKNNVVFVAFNHSPESLRTASAKMALRIDCGMFHFVAFKDVITCCSSFDNVADSLRAKILSLLTKDQRNLVVFEDFDVLHDLGYDLGSDLQFLQRLKLELPESSQIIIGSCNPVYDSLFNIFNLRFKLRPIGAGFGKNVTGEMNIFQRDVFGQSCGSTHTFHYFVGERNVQIFCPGSIQNLM
uniref:Elongator complex protein 6 n=1 Tax=Ditylenchus dipsaci TaxID=166011 RepID=A0A915DTV9_9BILA